MNIEKEFARRAHVVRNPLSGQELRDEALRLLAELRRMEAINKRIDRLESNPESAVSWRDIRRDGVGE